LKLGTTDLQADVLSICDFREHREQGGPNFAGDSEIIFTGAP